MFRKYTNTIIGLILLFVCICSCQNNAHKAPHDKDAIFKSKILEHTIDSLITHIDSIEYNMAHRQKADTELLALFPVDSHTFERLYGNEGILKNQIDVLSILYYSPFTNKKEVVQKFIMVSSGLTWDIDNINYFQNLVQKMLIEYIIESINTLNSLSVKTNYDFWVFVFSGFYPYYYDEEYHTIKALYGQNNYSYLQAMEMAFEYCKNNPVQL